MSVDHYENFPVASLLLPAKLRPAVAAIYQFARTADDLADEGDATPCDRLIALSHFDDALTRIQNGEPSETPLFIELAKVIQQCKLPLAPFYSLLSAFKQDVQITRYDNFAQLLDYCQRSANPVGVLMLHLYEAATPENLSASDDICTALQLINFWQDIAIDWEKRRIYLPQEDLRRFHITETQLSDQVCSEEWQQMMRFETQRSRALLLRGSPLAKCLPGRIGWELRLVVQGGWRILELIDRAEGDIFRHRPVLKKMDYLVMLWRTIRM